MTRPRDWHDAEDPAYLFLALWRYVNAMSRERLANNIEPADNVARQVATALKIDDATEAVRAVCDVLEAAWSGGTTWVARRERAGLALCAMREIDAAILEVHPRSVTGGITAATLPAWLDDVRERRTSAGAYAADDRFSLIARGPFARSPRMPLEEATFLLGDQFAALKVIDLSQFNQDGKPLRVKIRVVDQSVDEGVPVRRDRSGSEVVSFVPLAEAKEDLAAEITTDNGVSFLDIKKGATFEPAKRFHAAVCECSDSDILIAPELTIDPSDVDEIADLLSAMRGARPRLMVPGSGLHDGGAESGLPYNQTTILNGNGKPLWEHRKVSAYEMHQDTADSLNIPGKSGPAQLMERIAWSDEITIADVDGLGRCLVLICQDLRMEVVQHLLAEFRPDWVFVPILDTGTSLTRWPANRARDLARLTEARFVVVSSLTMKEWADPPYTGEQMGVAVGPARVNVGDKADKPGCQAEVAPESTTNRHATLRWRSHRGWGKFN